MKFIQQKASPVFTVDFYLNEPLFKYIDDDIINEFMTSLPGVLYVDGVRFDEGEEESGVGFRIDIVFVFDDMQAHISDVKFALDTYLAKKGVLRKADRKSFILKGIVYSDNKKEGDSSMFGRKSPYDKFIYSLKEVDISKTNKDFFASFDDSISSVKFERDEMTSRKLQGTTTSITNCVVKGSLDSIIESLAFAKSVSGESVLSKVGNDYYLTIAGSVDFKVSACEVFTSEQQLTNSVPNRAEIVIPENAVVKLGLVSHNSVEELN